MDHELMETVLRAIAEPHRLEIVRLVRSEELTAGQIAARFEVSRPAISQHLRLLRDAGLITERRQGTRRFYRGQPETLAALLVDLELLVENGMDEAVVIPPSVEIILSSLPPSADEPAAEREDLCQEPLGAHTVGNSN
jgi:DNA-binding transcriptional ArsR family regulator